MTKEEITNRFKAEFKDLLAKYGADIEAADHWSGYAECGEDVRITVNIPGKYDSEGNVIQERVEIDFGNHFGDYNS